MLARNDVHMHSPQLAGKVEQLEVWFAEAGGGQGSGGGGQGPGVRGSRSEVRRTPRDCGRGAVDNRLGALAPSKSPAACSAPACCWASSRPRCADLTIEDGVQFLETQTAQPGERPLLIRGDRLDAANVSAPDATVTITGRPAASRAAAWA